MINNSPVLIVCMYVCMIYNVCCIKLINSVYVDVVTTPRPNLLLKKFNFSVEVTCYFIIRCELYLSLYPMYYSTRRFIVVSFMITPASIVLTECQKLMKKHQVAHSQFYGYNKEVDRVKCSSSFFFF